MAPEIPADKNHPPPPENQPEAVNGNGNGVALPSPRQSRLRMTPKSDHQPESYEDMHLEFSPLLLSSLERYLPLSVISTNRDNKLQYMRDILHNYTADDDREQNHGDYRKKIKSNYQRLHKELYAPINAEDFFVPSFLAAINENTPESFKNIMVEPVPGVFTFEMLQPHFCDLLLSEVENFERWTHDMKIRIMRPNTMNDYGVVLDDVGMDTMLGEFMTNFISPITKVFFPEVGGHMLDSHHGYVVEYGMDRDTDLGFHVDDSEVTLNVCLGKEFSGGDLYFRGVRCDDHVNSEILPEEVLDYSHVPGQAVLHSGYHRHGARAIITGRRLNLILWCRSSIFREMKKLHMGCSAWCGECKRIIRGKHLEKVNDTKQALLKKFRKIIP